MPAFSGTGDGYESELTRTTYTWWAAVEKLRTGSTLFEPVRVFVTTRTWFKKYIAHFSNLFIY